MALTGQDKITRVRSAIEELQNDSIVSFKMNSREATATYEDGVTITVPIKKE